MSDNSSNQEKIMVTRSSLPPLAEYIEAIRPLWQSHWLTNMGAVHNVLEVRLKDYLEVQGISLFVNGHMALEMAIQAFGFPPGSEVITTPFTFISTTHAILRNNLVPVFCDVKAVDGTIDESKIDALLTPKTVAILPVHVYGNVCAVEKIEAIAKEHGLKVIYDAAHAFGVKYKGKGIGCFGDAAVFSFHATKVFHTIEGGAVAFSAVDIYEKLHNLKNFGIKSEDEVIAVGANAKLNEFAAAMGLCNLNHIDEALVSRQKIDELYRRRLENVKGIELIAPQADTKRNYAYFPIFIGQEYPLDRDGLRGRLAAQGIMARKYFYPLTSDADCFDGRYATAALAVAQDLSSRVLTLPIYEGLTEETAEKICDTIENTD